MRGLLLMAAFALLTAGLGISALRALLPDLEREELDRQHAAAAPFIKALEAREVIVQPKPQPREKPERRTAQVQETDCTTANLTPAHDPFEARVGRIIDGDTLTVLLEGDEIRVRLWGIDAPETKQAGGQRATAGLESIIPPGTMANVHPVETDRYGRMVAVIGPEDGWALNVIMAARGHAFHVDAYGSKGNRCLREAERAARDQRMGVWEHGDNAVRPWEYRSTARGDRG
jgi:endonuclease YncB( thermonuclease family)